MASLTPERHPDALCRCGGTEPSPEPGLCADCWTRYEELRADDAEHRLAGGVR